MTVDVLNASNKQTGQGQSSGSEGTACPVCRCFKVSSVVWDMNDGRKRTWCNLLDFLLLILLFFVEGI